MTGPPEKPQNLFVPIALLLFLLLDVGLIIWGWHLYPPAEAPSAGAP